jgi:hypothetical protein
VWLAGWTFLCGQRFSRAAHGLLLTSPERSLAYPESIIETNNGAEGRAEQWRSPSRRLVCSDDLQSSESTASNLLQVLSLPFTLYLYPHLQSCSCTRFTLIRQAHPLCHYLRRQLAKSSVQLFACALLVELDVPLVRRTGVGPNLTVNGSS